MDEAKIKFLNDIGIYKRYHNVNENEIQQKDKILNYCNNLIQNINNGKGLLIIGNVGTGKTCILSYIAQKIFNYNLDKNSFELLDDKKQSYIFKKPISVLFIRMPTLYDCLFERNSGIESRCYKADVLLLDDFGSEYGTEYPITKFENLIEYRYAKQKTIIITSNFSIAKLENLETHKRIIDRWREMTETIVINTKSKRLKK